MFPVFNSQNYEIIWLTSRPGPGVMLCFLGKRKCKKKFNAGISRATLQGQCHEIFDFWLFSWISFPPAPENNDRVVSNFFENSRRYSQLKVHHRCQRHRWKMEKTTIQKKINYFVPTPLGRRFNIYIKFCLQVHFKVSAAWYCSHYLPLVSLTGGKFAAGVVGTGSNLPMVVPVAKFAAGVFDAGGALWLASVSENFQNDPKVIFRGFGEGVIHEKTWSKKSRDTVPLQ